MPELITYLILYAVLWLNSVRFLFSAGLLLLERGITFRNNSARDLTFWQHAYRTNSHLRGSAQRKSSF